MRRNCPLNHLPRCAGQDNEQLCDPVNAQETARRSLYLSSLEGWPSSGYRPDPAAPRICPLIFPDPPPEQDPAVVGALPRTARLRGSLSDAVRRERLYRRGFGIPRE